MEALQASGYAVIDQCGAPSNQVITLLSYLHIVFQPFFINAFAMELVPGPVRERLRLGVYLCCAASSAVMLAQLYPFEWAGSCRLGAALCGTELCLVSGEWHIAWDIPYNGLLLPLEDALGIDSGFPTYLLVAFLLPLACGVRRAFLWMSIRSSGESDVSATSASSVRTEWTTY
jgi:hypothetical protein